MEAKQPGFVQFKRPGEEGATYALGLTPSDSAEGPELWWYVDDAEQESPRLVGRQHQRK